MADIKDQLIKNSYNYVLQSDLSTGVVYRIGGTVPVNPIFLSGLTVNSSFTYSNGTEQPGYFLTTDGSGYSYWSSVSGTSTSGTSLYITGTGVNSTVRCGVNNTAAGDFGGALAGSGNTASGKYSFVGGGRDNTASSIYSTVGGGYCNTASGDKSTVSGGAGNTASAYYSTVGGGRSNTASCYNSTVSGGYNNTASGSYSFIAGGVSNNTNNLACAFIVGSNITADMSGTTFVNQLSIKNIPTSSAGLSSGAVWSNGGNLEIIP